MELRKEFTFSAAHWLPNVPEDHKCRRLHGHTYRGVVTLRGPVGEQTGWVRDFADVSAVWKDEVHNFLDHRSLNDEVTNPTAENVAVWVWNQLLPFLSDLERVEIWETPTSMAAVDRRFD